MKAIVLESFDRPPALREVPTPAAAPGEVLVEVQAARVLSYMGDVLDGRRAYLLTPPMVPGAGAVGRLLDVGPDAPELKVGDQVFVDPTVRARDNPVSPVTNLQGLTAGDSRGLRLQAWMRDGTWAEQVRVPTENVVRLPPETSHAPEAWVNLGAYLVPFGGFDAVHVRAGEVVVVSGATGAFGSAAVVVALALGASRVVATGRNEPRLRALERRLGSRVRAAVMRGDEAGDTLRIVEAAEAPIDVVLDLLPPEAKPAQARAAMKAVRPFGRVVLMGGIRDELSLPYAWFMRNCITVRGQWMYTRATSTRAVQLAHAGLLPLDVFEVATFPLERVNDAVAHAATHAGAFQVTVLKIP